MCPATVAPLQSGLEALAAGRWEEARDALERATTEVGADQADAFDALAEALWWLGRSADAAAARERAFVLHRQQGNPSAAARVAAWLSREYGGPLGNASAGRGWLARAESLAAEGVDPGAGGWLALARSGQSADRADQAGHAQRALTQARQCADRDLEILALARLGVASIGLGDVEGGVANLDEAMAAATAGEADRLSTVADVYCQLVVAADMLGDTTVFGEWSRVLSQMSKKRNLPVLMEFCECCQAEESVDRGDLHGAELHLKQALTALENAGQRPRCLAPGPKLADLWISQGRLADAEHILARIDVNDALLPRARLALAQGNARLARALADRFLRRRGIDVVAKANALTVLADGALASADATAAREAMDALVELARSASHPRIRGLAALVQARVAVAERQPGEALVLLEQALDALAALPTSVEAGLAHLELAHLRADEPSLALTEAKQALRIFDAIGAAREADMASALLRSLGDHSRVGAKGIGGLTARERDVLMLLGQGRSNAEIARQLYISTKTAGNHVSNIFTKLGLRNRAEAAAYALRHAGNGEGE